MAVGVGEGLIATFEEYEIGIQQVYEGTLNRPVFAGCPIRLAFSFFIHPLW